MIPAAKSRESGSGYRKSHRSDRRRLSQGQEEINNSVGSPASKKSQGSSRATGKRHRSRRSPEGSSALREALSSFGDDVIRVKHYPGLYAYDNHGYFQPDFSFDAATELKDRHETSPSEDTSNTDMSQGGHTGGIEGELATIMSRHDPSFHSKHFEKVNASEVGVRSSKWQKLLQASVSSNRLQKFRGQGRKKSGDFTSSSEQNNLEEFYNSEGRLELSPPYWGVSKSTREKITFLNLSLILHELACFASCILLGCSMFQAMEAVSWVQQSQFIDNWTFFKLQSSFQTLLVVVTSVGFLNRVDTSESRSLWLFPLFLLPVLGLSISDYCNKAWELQRMECQNYFKLDEITRQKVHLSQECPVPLMTIISDANDESKHDLAKPNRTFLIEKGLTELEARGTASLVMRILATLSALVMALYLFCCRKSHFLIETFGLPQEFMGNINLISLASNETKSSKMVDEENGDVKVIFQQKSKGIVSHSQSENKIV